MQQDIKIASVGWVSTTQEILDNSNQPSNGIEMAATESNNPNPSESVCDAPVYELLSLTTCINAVSDFRVATDDLVASLAAVSELLQVNKAATSDSWRKLRPTESGLTRMRAETDSIQTSQDLIHKWERSGTPRQSAIPGLLTPPSKLANGSSILGSTQCTNFSIQARSHLQSAQDLLDEASAQAYKLLAI